MLFVLAGFAFGTGAFSNVTTDGRRVTDHQLAVRVHPGDARVFGVERISLRG
jgi:hypothetical protein